MFTLKTTLFTAAFVLLPGFYVSAGDLTPPAGAPSSTMKTLDEIEPRIPIHGQANQIIVIDEPGHYFLAEPLVESEGVRIESDAVTLDLSGLSHELPQGIEVDVPSVTSNVVIRNGRLSGGSSVAMNNPESRLRLQGVVFEGGHVEVLHGRELNLSRCQFYGNGDYALYVRYCDVVIDDTTFEGYNEAIALSESDSTDALWITNGRFRGNTASVVAYGGGTVKIVGCQFDGADDSNSQSPRAFEMNGLRAFSLVNSNVSNYGTVFEVTGAVAQVRVEGSQFENFESILQTIENVSGAPYLFDSCSFAGEGPSQRAYDLVSGDVTATFKDSSFTYFDHISVGGNHELSFEGCHFGGFQQYYWPDGSLLSACTILTDGETQFFASGMDSRFVAVKIRTSDPAGSPFNQALVLEQGAILDGCELFNQPYGVEAVHHSAVIRDTVIQFSPDYGRGETAIRNSDSSFRTAMLVENTLISGYQNGLDGGSFQSNQLTVRDCGKAFDNIDNLQLSSSNVFVENLGEVHGVAVLTDSSLRTSNVGFWVGQAEVRNCSFTNQDHRSSRGLEIAGNNQVGGSIHNSTFSGFYTGVYSLEKVGIYDSTFSDCTDAIYIAAPRSVVARNMVFGCDTGIQAGDGATVVENTVSVVSSGITGTGLIVKNMVTVETTPAYSLGAGTHGRVLTGATINPSPSSEVNDAGEPWANLYHQY
ncbi:MULTISPECIES: right-handed parallel beta-helix repeat-containing protein [unclassified Lentimonas]|uniref:right-handed parallel beta-helix repeat-containing protein n=1 Tax=unclassified Lentimonas TaxID=2630993 RepID=UPI0013281FD8|nr:MULTISPECIES: right-handed parallel beta-helix repeat-containing protein [unclassified Lentimonas]CAA6693576.1 Unannotated [Lentimonas sp. CC10]CAA6696881.1 Unannotated [Lentimonas sp. CC19]CAA7071164.1 Unannotated [Lentimonas sp. CC11]